ncbi:ABC transporter ATP-binding protein [Niallia sp. Sow4_A1]|jgi:ATP-binding cassette, subfamily B, bacterial|uniref:ABC transporter ATP-binding protein n=1 Tax=Bacillaceae TaxID=186817 RepID=UPI0004E2519D|nr:MULTISPECIES: ABC transporter ATP-binding protein [Bacillaceae]MCF2647782.1 ABC transporter ATP-binding protein [Niallia circulans]CAI9397080.1 Putative multidrug export ATP-binding/permease protein [Bacillus sp. T2.9-1]
MSKLDISKQKKIGDGKRVIQFLMPYKKWVIGDSLVIAISQVFSALIPTLALSWLIDTILPSENNTWLWGLMWLLVLSAVLDLGMMIIDEYFCHITAKSVTNRQKLRLFGHLQVLPFSFYQNNSSGELLARTSDDPDTLHNFLAWEGSTFMASAQGVVIYSIVLLFIHPYLMITSVVLGILFYWASNYVGARTRAASADARAEASKYLERLRESVTGIHLSRVMGVSDSEVNSVVSIRDSFVKHSLRELKARMQSVVVIASYNGFALGLVYFISTLLIWNGDLTSGQMLTAGGLVTIAANEMQRLLRNWLSVRRTGPALDRSDILLSQPVSEAETKQGVRGERASGDVRLKDVSFVYPDKEESVLKGVSFAIKAGEKIALVGPSGSGKSTIIDLLFRLYDTTKGSIEVDGREIREWDTDWLRSQMAIVTQDVLMRSGTLADNLRIGKSDATEKELYDVLRASGLGELLETLPDGLNTKVGERGSLLSGGQKQRLSLARAILKDAPILVLDEASSALDPITEAKINEAVLKTTKKQTIFIISHRLSTVLSADRIIVLDKGVIVEEGTHNELLKNNNGVYSRLFKREADIGEATVNQKETQPI